jgi:hypothetical protein
LSIKFVKFEFVCLIQAGIRHWVTVAFYGVLVNMSKNGFLKVKFWLALTPITKVEEIVPIVVKHVVVLHINEIEKDDKGKKMNLSRMVKVYHSL